MAKCNCCNRFIKTVDIIVDGGEVVLVLPNTIFENYEQACICIAQRIPETSALETVYIQAGIGSNQRFPLMTTMGAVVYTYQIRSRKVYPVIAVSDNNMFVVSPKFLQYSGKVLNVVPTPSGGETPKVE